MITVFNKLDAPNTQGISLKDYVKVTYDELVGVLGEPTFPEESGDSKVQVEWVVEYCGELFTIYDWKTYDRDYTINKLDNFHIGGKSYAGYLTEYLLRTIDND